MSLLVFVVAIQMSDDDESDDESEAVSCTLWGACALIDVRALMLLVRTAA